MRIFIMFVLGLMSALATGCDNMDGKTDSQQEQTINTTPEQQSEKRNDTTAQQAVKPVEKTIDTASHPVPDGLPLQPARQDDPRLWLEEVEGEQALEQVRSWNKRSLDDLMADPRYKTFEDQALKILNAQDKIPYPSYRGDYVANFWQDSQHVRGLWRTTSLENYLSATPVWETILDIDKLAEEEKKNWVYKGASCLEPSYNLCMLTLSDGGKDASVRREFDISTKSFVETGFHLEESKGSTAWLDKDHLLVAVDFGKDTLTSSGYPYVVKLWTRGTPLTEAKELIRGDKTDVAVWPFVITLEGGRREAFALQSKTFFESQNWWLPEGRDPVPLPLPQKSTLQGTYKDQLLVTLEEDWRGFSKGSLISFSLKSFFETGKIRDIKPVYTPHERASLESVAPTKSGVLVTLYENVKGEARVFEYKDEVWSSTRLDLPKNGSVKIVSANAYEDIAFINTESFLHPDTLWMVNTQEKTTKQVKSLPERFNPRDLQTEQFEARSRDGTRIPYFVIRKKGGVPDGKNPTLLYGYGGFQISLTPSYSGVLGKLWLERGGVYVLANIRGGGEFGPTWHQAGLKTERQHIYDDFIAVAEDLITRNITTPEHLGIMGGSNGGLLMGVMYTQRPDLWHAVVCQVPLLDMLRFHKLLAGASWVAEYGDPDKPQEGAFLESISPYHNLKAGGHYPDIFFLTSTKDDRVHPGHARKMAKLIEEAGYPFLYYENIDGGHSAAANLKESARRTALEYVFLSQRLMDGAPSPDSNPTP